MVKRSYKKKINLLGDVAVGKTSLILRFVRNVFGGQYLKTVGTNVYNKEVSIMEYNVNLVIFDIMGESGYDNVQKTAFRGSSGALAVADCTRKQTLDNLVENWIPKYREMASEEAPIFLAINKNDLKDKKEIGEKLVALQSDNFDSIYFTSAKTAKNVDEIFRDLAFNTLYQPLSPVKSVEEMISSENIDTTKKLMGALLTYASELGDINYHSKEALLKESGIDRFALEEDIPEEETLEFGNELIDWFEKRNDQDSAEKIEKAIDKYKEDS